MKDYSNLDGEVVDYQILSGISNVKDNPLDSQNFYPMSGEKHSNFRIFGIGKPSAGQIERQERRDEKKDMRMDRKYDRNERKNIRTDAKAAAKTTQAQSQLEIAKSLSAPDSTAAAIAALGGGGGAMNTNQGMSAGMKIGIAVLVLGVVGFIGYKVYKAKKK